jgi:deoxyribodipyrimidine photo-lyase
MTPTRCVLVWLRRDLRLEDNLALHHAAQSGALVVVLYVLDPAILRSPRVGAPRVGFMLSALSALDADLRGYGARLLIRQGRPTEVVPAVAQELRAEALYYNRDYTPYARRRDARVEAALSERGIIVHSYHDRVLLPPDALRTGTGSPYTVFTPFKNKWRATPKPFSEPVDTVLRGVFMPLDGAESLPVPSLQDLGFGSTVQLPPATVAAARKRLDDFVSQRIYGYRDGRNRLSGPFDDPHSGTSLLSPYLRWGLLSPRQVRQAAVQSYRAASNDDARESVDVWVDELIWAEFYIQVLWHFPQVVHQSFKPEYEGVAWRIAPEELAAWQEGQTGYPVVDAAMRQLKQTGWMHNRARMIVASFLTKDLLIDWREGERWFMQHLLDGDTAANNGGWQWSASTGTDAQPYFRIFNPVSQGQKFDPDGAYIQRWVGELRGLSPRHLHAPWTMQRPPAAYPPPMVDHALARERTLSAFKSVTRTKE